MKVSVVLALPTRQQVLQLDVVEGCTARQAVQLATEAGLAVSSEELDILNAPLGIYAERVSDDALLQAGDRVEIYRPLQQDPMELRRRRAASESGRLTSRRK